jgi:hypothetical protein
MKIKTKPLTFQIGDRVTMRSALTPTNGKLPPILVGTVEAWSEGQIVRWDDWPCMTALPNPNVHKVE